MVQPQLLSNFDGDDDTTLVAVMTEAEAIAAEREIVTTGNRLRALLVEFYERRGWAALGYQSWRGWAAVRLGESERSAYRELTAGLVEREIVTHVSELGNQPLRQLQPLTQFVEMPRGPGADTRPVQVDGDAIRETWNRANELAAEEGRPVVSRHVAAAVQERQPAPEPSPPPVLPFRSAPSTLPTTSWAPPAPPAAALSVAPPAPAPPPMAVHFSSATPEWYTPAHIVERVEYLFGRIDLDPCSNAKGDAANVPARVHFTRDDNGLAQSWRIDPHTDDYGDESLAVRVYMNPPYGDEIGAWVDRLVRAYESGEITEGVALLPARVDTAWWRKLRAYAVCFVAGRLKFSGAENSAPFPSAIVYLGSDVDGFNDAFSEIGEVRPAAMTPRIPS